MLQTPPFIIILYYLFTSFSLNILSSLQLQTNHQYLRVSFPLVLYISHLTYSLPTFYFYLINTLYHIYHFINILYTAYVLLSYQLSCPLIIFTYYMSGFFEHSHYHRFYNTSFSTLSLNYLSSLQLQTHLTIPCVQFTYTIYNKLFQFPFLNHTLALLINTFNIYSIRNTFILIHSSYTTQFSICIVLV